MDIQEKFSLPLNLVAPEISFQMAAWFELLGRIALAIRLGTRVFSAPLFVLTIVAIASLNWPESWMNFSQLMQGYGFTDKGFGNFKLPILFLGMLLPLTLLGPGRFSIDHWLRQKHLPESLQLSEKPRQVNDMPIQNPLTNNFG